MEKTLWPIRIYLWLVTLFVVWAAVTNPVSCKWFDLISKQTGVEFDNSSQADHDTVRGLMRETFIKE